MESSWYQLGRQVKKTILNAAAGKKGFSIELCGVTMKVAYPSRRAREERDYPALKALAKNKNCILDVGANQGLTAIMMAQQMQPKGKLYALEAYEDVARIAQTNVALNGLSERIRVVNALIADRTGDVLNFYGFEDSSGASLIKSFLGHDFPIQKAAITIDTFCERVQAKPELIKIDVEGAEGRVLNGMTQILSQQKPLVFVELHHWEGTSVSANAASILDFIHTINYEMIYLRTQTEVQDPSVFSDRGRCHVLLRPPSVTLTEMLEDIDTSGL